LGPEHARIAQGRTAGGESTKDVSYTEIQARYRSIVIGRAANIVAALIGAGIAHLA